MNKFQRDPEHFVNLANAISFLTVSETIDVLNRDITTFAKSLNIRSTGNRYQVGLRIKKRIELGIPELPHFEPKDIPKIHECDGCRDIADVEGLRWAKLNRGEAVTWSIDRDGQPNDWRSFTDREIQGWFEVWTSIQGNRVTKAPRGQKGDCHINFKRIDGPGKTLGFVLQPRGNVEFMRLAGDLSGDMTIDNSERQWPLARTRTFGRHEAGHFFGLQHSDLFTDLLYRFLMGDGEKLPQPGDKNQYKQRYISQREFNTHA